MRQAIQLANNEQIDLKQYEPDMRHLIDIYIGADKSESIAAFEDLTLVQLLLNRGIEQTVAALPESIRKDREAIAAPLHLSLDTVRLFAVSKLSWIEKKRAQFHAQERQSPRKYVSGETHYYHGQPYRLQVHPTVTKQRVERRDRETLHLYFFVSQLLKTRRFNHPL